MTGFDPRFTYMLTPWKVMGTGFNEKTKRPTGFYARYCDGFWENQFIVRVPGSYSFKDVQDNTPDQLQSLLVSLDQNLIWACYDSVLEKLGLPPYD